MATPARTGPIAPIGVRARRWRLLSAVVLALLALAAPASAATTAPGTLASAIRVPSMGGFTIGIGTLTTTLTATGGTATVTAPGVGLGKNHVFRIDVCVRAKTSSTSTSCEHRLVDTTDRRSAIHVAAPAATVSFERPAAGRPGHVTSIVSVSHRRPNGSWREVATTWPPGGLADAAIVVPAKGAATGVLAPPEGAVLPGLPHLSGGVNTGFPGSFCAPAESPGSGAAVPDGVTHGALGTGAPAYHEVGEPTGAHAGREPKGVMFVIHGGGWFVVGRGAVEKLRPTAERWRARGWRTVSISHRGCGPAPRDVLWFHDRARAAYGSDLPFCAAGESAGGHLALILAWARPGLACAISAGGPTDPAALEHQGAWAASDPTGNRRGSRWAHNMAVAAWGEDDLAWYAPASFRAHARVLMGVAERDPYVPYAQATGYRQKRLARDPDAYVDVARLGAGDRPWVHANVSQAALDDFHRREEALVAPIVDAG